VKNEAKEASRYAVILSRRPKAPHKRGGGGKKPDGKKKKRAFTSAIKRKGGRPVGENI